MRERQSTENGKGRHIMAGVNVKKTACKVSDGASQETVPDEGKQYSLPFGGNTQGSEQTNNPMLRSAVNGRYLKGEISMKNKTMRRQRHIGNGRDQGSEQLELDLGFNTPEDGATNDQQGPFENLKSAITTTDGLRHLSKRSCNKAKWLHSETAVITRREIYRNFERALARVEEAATKKIDDQVPLCPMTPVQQPEDLIFSGRNIHRPLHYGKGNHSRRISPEVEQIICDEINNKFVHRTRLSTAAVYDAIVCRIMRVNADRDAVDTLTIPGITTVYREVKKMKRHFVNRVGYGKSMFNCDLEPVKQDGFSERLGGCGEPGHVMTDIYVVDPVSRMPIGRPWLTITDDVHTEKRSNQEKRGQRGLGVWKSPNGGGKIIGQFPSVKTSRRISFKSQMERDYLYLLEMDPDVSSRNQWKGE